jgi:phosphoenolpyruvate carboxylase
VVKAFAAHFQLVNLAEEEERVRVLHARADRARAGGEPTEETIAAAVRRLHAEGLAANEVQVLLDNLFIMPVFTAHPTEAKRRTVLTTLNRILDALHELDFHQPTPDEVAVAREDLREEIVSLLTIGSRPARRRATNRINDLRAIPWVFAWTQSRAELPGWYVLGTALKAWAGEQEPRWALLRTMYREWPFFKAVIDNAQVSMGKADMPIAEVYSGLADCEARVKVFPVMVLEFNRTTAAILRLTEQQESLGQEPWLQRAIRLRNP